MASSMRSIPRVLGRAPCSPIKSSSSFPPRVLSLRIPQPQPQTTALRTFTTTPLRPRAKTMGQLKARNSTGPFSWKAGMLFIVTGAGLMIYFRVEKERLERKRVAELSKGVGRPKVGGPFTLKDLDGKEFTAEDLKGKYSFVCPVFDYPNPTGSVFQIADSVSGIFRLHALPRYLPRRTGQNGRDHRPRQGSVEERVCPAAGFHHL